jgi:arylformamidase
LIRATLTLLFVLGAQPAFAGKGADGPARDPDQYSVPYGADPHQVLDLYLSHAPGPHRLVVFAHGGGFEHGGKGPGRFLAPALNDAGYVLASVNYREVPAVDVAQSVGDVAQAAAFLLRHAAYYHIDPHGFAVAGHSSGAHIAALLGTDPAYMQRAGIDPGSVRAVLALDGVYDVTANLTEYPTAQRFAVFGHDPANWRAFSPTEIVRATPMHPRFCVAHEDTKARQLEQANLFIAALRAHGAALETLNAPGFTHSEMAKLFSDRKQPVGPFAIACLDRGFAGK